MNDAVRTVSPVLGLLRGRLGRFGSQRRGLRGRLFRKYVLLLVGLVSFVLLVNAGLHFWFSYSEEETAAYRLQQEKARSAARRIEEFVDEIENQLGWTTAPQWAAAPLEQREFDYVRLLRQEPAITELIQLDSSGKEQLRVSRLAMDVVGSGKDYSQEPSFTEAKKYRVWFSPVYFRKESEPYLTLAMAQAGPNAGVTIAEVNLKLIWDVVSSMKIGRGGYAYVIDRNGRLIAHPDISLVLRDTDMMSLPQVAAARAEAQSDQFAPPVMVAKNLNGETVLTAHATILPLGWTVFVELPLREALAPLYRSMMQSAALLAVALGLAALAALFLARRMVGPIRLLQAGAARIGAGELGRRIEIHSGDELEELAGEFNRMAGDLQKSYADLEKKVENRTAELKEALDQQTATAKVLQVINSSPGDLAPVFDAMLEKAMQLCEAAFGILLVRDGDQFRTAALHGVPSALAEFLSDTPREPGKRTAVGRMLDGEDFVQFEDMTKEPAYQSGDPRQRAFVELGRTRTYVAVALRKDGRLVGTIAAYRQEIRLFNDKQIALLQNFAAQAVIAIENARLITETREALEQQTATAEVLQVINSSPGDLAPVFDAVLEKALRLCGAAYGHLATFDGERFHRIAVKGEPRVTEYARRRGPFEPRPDGMLGRIASGENVVYVEDVLQSEEYHANPHMREIVDIGGHRTSLSVALRKEGTLFGTIGIWWKEVRSLSDKQIALLQNFAAQAVIAMENARLLTETREALEQQTATAEVLQVINSSPGDLTPVFDAILEKGHSLCGADTGTLQIYDGRHFRAVATRGIPAAYAEELRRPHRVSRIELRGRLVAGDAVAHADLAEIDDPAARAAVERGGVRTLLFVALRKDDTLLGAISAGRKEVRPFSPKEIALFENFAAQAVIAMENVRLITELRQRTDDLQDSLEYQTATSDVLRVVSRSTFDLDSVLQTVVTMAVRLCRADSATIYRNVDGEYQWAAGHMLLPDYEQIERNVRIRPGTGTLVGRAASERRTVQILDAWTDPLYEVKDDARVGGVHSMIGVPLLREGAPIGVIGLARRRVEAFSERENQLVTTFADQAVIAIENARLITELRQRTRDLEESLEYQTASGDVLKVISQSGGELAPVLDTLVDTAARICRADSGFIFRLQEGLCRMAASFGIPAEYKEFQERNPITPSRGTLAGRTVLERRAVHIADAATDPEYTRAQAVQLGRQRTMLGVPLIREDTLIGVITLGRSQVEPFSEKQIGLVTTFADQAVIAIENARLFDELRQRTRDLQETLEYQTATSDVLKVISQSTFDLQPVLETLAETAARLCDAEMAFIFRRQGELYRVSASIGFSPETKALVEANPISPGRGTVAGRTALTASIVHIPDARLDPEYTWGEFVRVAKTPTMLGVPLLREGVPVGVMVLARQRVEPFGEKQIELVRTFADQAVIAIENTRLFNELRERTAELGRSVEELKMLNDVAQAVSSTLDLRTVLSTVLTASLGVTQANAGAVFRYSRAERAFRLVEAAGWHETLMRSVRDLRVAEAETAMGEAAARRMPVQLTDLAQRASYPLRDITLAAGFRSALAVPLVGADRILGAIILMRQEAGEFPPETVRLMQTLASQSVLAIQNARLFREIADKSEQLALASQHKSQFLANMSHELRTPLNAILGYAELLVDGIYGVLPERPRGVIERMQNNGKHLLALINDVLDLAKIEAGQLTLTLEDYSLPEVVKAVVTATEPLGTAKGLKFTAVVPDDMPMAHGDARRVSQVLLNLVGNAIKFTDAGEVEIRAATERGQLVLTVRDTGPGIPDADQDRIFGEFQQIDNSNTRKKGGTGLGLAISKRMVEMQGGTISVDSVVGQGSTFRVLLPLRVEEVLEEAAE